MAREATTAVPQKEASLLLLSQEQSCGSVSNLSKLTHKIVVLDEKGIASKEIAFALEEMGYMNAFFVLDGFQSLLPENR